jgi:hypothetical protein
MICGTLRRGPLLSTFAILRSINLQSAYCNLLLSTRQQHKLRCPRILVPAHSPEAREAVASIPAAAETLISISKQALATGFET